MLRKIFFHIQRQPRESREHYALAGAVTVTGLLALLWVGYIAMFPSANVYTASVSERENRAVVAETESAPAPFSSFWGQVKEQMADLRSIGEAMESDAEVPAVSTTTPTDEPESHATSTRATTESRNVTITHEPADNASSSTVPASTTPTTASSPQP